MVQPARNALAPPAGPASAAGAAKPPVRAMAPPPGAASGHSRPLSPHLQIYRWSWTMAMSIFHRATGAALYGGTLLLVYWLVSLASGPQAFATAQAIFGSWLGRLVLFGYTWALMHHMSGGIRHLVWDTGVGYSREARMGMAKATLASSLTLTLLIWGLALWLK